jgi:predicted enzyme related to lactoylglutathione lyase
MPEKMGRPAEMEMALVVRDLDKMTHFYGEAVGLPHLYDFHPLEGGLVVRRYTVGDGAVFKLMAFDEPPVESSPPDGIRGATGFRHMLIVVDDLEASVQRCVDAGATIVRPIQRYGDTGPVISIMYDPEGNSIELVQRGS